MKPGSQWLRDLSRAPDPLEVLWQANSLPADEVESFAVAPSLTTTEPLAKKLLGTSPSGGRDTAAFAYRYVARATTVAAAFEGTAQTLVRLLDGVGDRPVFITSDHDYLWCFLRSTAGRSRRKWRGQCAGSSLGKAGPGRCTAHGGLSLAESPVPVMSIVRCK